MGSQGFVPNDFSRAQQKRCRWRRRRRNQSGSIQQYRDPFYRITYLIKGEIRKYKWIEGEKGRTLSWQQARSEWTEAQREEYEKVLLDTLPSADSVTGKLATDTEDETVLVGRGNSTLSASPA